MTGEIVSSNMDTPIALRKAKRRSSSFNLPRNTIASEQAVKTPSTRRSKRVRFSDPGLCAATETNATNLTPALRRSSLNTPSRRKRPATPSKRETPSGHLQFTPFRQTLDDRSQRRIRRNHLSEEQNEYLAEQKSKRVLLREIEEKDAELKRLKEELEQEQAKNAARTPRKGWFEPPVVSSQQRVQEVEAELDALRRSFAMDETTEVQTWDHVPIGPQGPGSESGDTILIHEDADADTDADAAMMGVELQAAKQAKCSFLGSFRDASTSFDFQFADSPMRPRSSNITSIPETQQGYHNLSKQLKATTNRAEEAELALTALDMELRALGFGGEDTEGLDLVDAISEHFHEARTILSRAIPDEGVSDLANNRLLPEIIQKLTKLTDKLKSQDQELRNAKDQHHNLKKNFEKAIVAAEKANAHIKKLESSIDTSAEDTLEARMRAQALERDLQAKEADVESLKTALDKYRSDIARLETLITQLEIDYAQRDALATHVAEEREQRIDELEAKATAEERGRRAAEDSAVSRLAQISDLETELASTRRCAEDLQNDMVALQAASERSSQDHGMHLGALNARISTLSTALASANAEVDKLKITKVKLEERVKQEVEQGARAVESLQEQLIRTVTRTNDTRKKYVNGAKVRIANWELAEEADSESGNEPMTPAGLVRFAEWADVEDDHVPGEVEIGRGRSRERKTPRLVSNGGLAAPMREKRRYDSGIGMSPTSDTDDGHRDSGMMTPEPSSDGMLDEQQPSMDEKEVMVE